MNFFIVYTEIKHLLHFLTQEEKGDLFDVLITYTETESEPSIENKNVANVFKAVKLKLDQQFAKAKIKIETARMNGKEGGRPSKKINRKPKITQSEPKKTESVIPYFVDQSLWNDFVQLRNSKKKPLTERSIKLILKDLEEFENRKMGNATLALENSIKNSWQGVFEPKPLVSSVNKAQERTRSNLETIMNTDLSK